MSVITIENYRGFDIEFNTANEQFQCIVTDEVTKESNSFSAIKKFIDEYKKSNQGFKPFYVIRTPDYYGSYERIKIIGIRKDKRFITQDGDKKGQLSEYNENNYMLEKESNNLFIQKLKTLEKEMDEYRLKMNEKRKEIKAKLDITTVKEYKQSLLSES